MISEEDGSAGAEDVVLTADECVGILSLGERLEIVVGHHGFFEEDQKLLDVVDDCI